MLRQPAAQPFRTRRNGPSGPCSGPPACSASGFSPLAAFALSMRRGVRSSSRGASSSTVAPPVRAAVTAPRPRGEPGAGPRQARGRGLTVARARCGDVAVRRHLPGHGRGRPAELRGDLAGAAVAVEHPLDRVPLVPREPPVRPFGRSRSGHAGLHRSRAGGFRPLWGRLPGFAPQDSAQRVALSPEAVAMKMRIKEASLLTFGTIEDSATRETI